MLKKIAVFLIALMAVSCVGSISAAPLTSRDISSLSADINPQADCNVLKFLKLNITNFVGNVTIDGVTEDVNITTYKEIATILLFKSEPGTFTYSGTENYANDVLSITQQFTGVVKDKNDTVNNVLLMGSFDVVKV